MYAVAQEVYYLLLPLVPEDTTEWALIITIMDTHTYIRGHKCYSPSGNKPVISQMQDILVINTHPKF